MKHLMTIKQARLLACKLSKELCSVCRCDFEGLWRMELTATDRKSYLEMYDDSIKESYPFKSTPTRNAQPCIPINWKSKPRGAARDEWQHIPEEFIEEMIQKYNIL